jgi:protein O-GlcNAc transferase
MTETTVQDLGDVDDAFEIALEHHQAGRMAEAETLYRRIIAADPEHPGALYLLGGIVYQQGRYDEAFAMVEKALEEEPNDPDALHLLGSIAYRQERHALAIELIDRALALHPAYAQAHQTRADVLLAQGELDAACAGYRHALGLEPRLPEAHCNLARALGLQGRLPEAAASYEQALALQPDLVGARCSLGEIFHEQGRLDAAIAQFREALSIAPDHAPGHGLLGDALHAKGDAESAAASYRRAIELQPGHAAAHNFLGAALKALGRTDEAVASYRRAIALAPDYAEAHSNLGVALRELGQLDEAIASYRAALVHRPDVAEIHANLANTLCDRGFLDEAITCYLQAIELRPRIAALHNYLGRAYKNNHQPDAAIASYAQAVALQPDYAEAYSNLGNAQLKQGRVEEAIASYRRALELEPGLAEVHSNLGIALKDCGRLDEAIDCFRRTVELKPDYIEGYTNYLVTAQYGPDYSPAQLLADHRAFGDRFEGPWRDRWPRHAPRATQRVRVGFVSGDFCEHPVGFFLEGTLGWLDREALDIVLYPTVHKTDDLTRRLQAMGFPWRPLAGLSDEQAAQRIAADGIDILVDLSGHTADHRLQLFARKPAPIQVAWLGYWATTGLQAMDYILCDPYAIPADEADHFVEQPWYLPETRLCFTPPADAILPGPLPALDNGYVTFGCFNNLTKMTGPVVELWARVLREVPESRLLLKSRTLADASTREAVRQRFAARGIAAERLRLEAQSSRHDYLLTYNRVDIALDPFPFTGATTSVEGLWMGVPFITLRGDRLVAHQGEGILHNMGMADWIAADRDAYVALAIAKAGDLQGLAISRAALRPRLLASPLCDGPRFARNLEAAFDEMWRRFRDAA